MITTLSKRDAHSATVASFDCIEEASEIGRIVGVELGLGDVNEIVPRESGSGGVGGRCG